MRSLLQVGARGMGPKMGNVPVAASRVHVGSFAPGSAPGYLDAAQPQPRLSRPWTASSVGPLQPGHLCRCSCSGEPVESVGQSRPWARGTRDDVLLRREPRARRHASAWQRPRAAWCTTFGFLLSLEVLVGFWLNACVGGRSCRQGRCHRDRRCGSLCPLCLCLHHWLLFPRRCCAFLALG